MVVPAGQAWALPLTDTAPPGLTVADVAPLVLQLSVEQEPAATLVGLAVKLFMTGFDAGGVVVGTGVGVAVGVGIGVGVTGTGVGAGVET